MPRRMSGRLASIAFAAVLAATALPICAEELYDESDTGVEIVDNGGFTFETVTIGIGDPVSEPEPATVPDTETDAAPETREELLKEIEAYEAEIRKEKEEKLKERVRSYHEACKGKELPRDARVHFICTDSDTDYAVVTGAEETYFYTVYVSRDGEYFVSEDGVGDETRAVLLSSATAETLSSTERFWNKVALMYTDGASLPSLPRDNYGVMCVPYYNQGAGYYVNGTWECTWWPDVTFNVNGHTMHQAGCGFFSTAMAMSYVTQSVIAPVDFKENGQYIAGDGSAVTVGVESAKMYGISAYITSNFDDVLTALQNGHPVMEHVGPSVFTSGGHYILLVGILPDGSIAVNDPGHKDNTYWYNGTVFPQSTILAAAKDRETAFTIFG